ncbi:MAG: 2-oxoacid:acceptor oxidoreductase subunit alpha [Dehalococcoidia bacterium]
MAVDLNILIGGEAGQGVQSIGLILSKVFTRGGYHVFTDQDYESRIRGGHSFCRVRIKDTQVQAISESVDLLVALNRESVDLHEKEVVSTGLIIAENDKYAGGDNKKIFVLPMSELAKNKAGNPLTANSVALGALMAITGYELELLQNVFKDHFKDNHVLQQNITAAVEGYTYTKNNVKSSFHHQVHAREDTHKIVMDGNEAVALGALAAGCKFVSAYPMTPSTPVIEYMASKENEMGLAVIQAEDEISAINMTIGAAFAGVRSMTATSGGGFCLMVEGFGLAGMTETPIVIAYGQRPGPAIGLPTRMEQGDLQFVLRASHGEFPRAVFAPGTIEEAFWLTVKAFNMAEKYQIPVVILYDHYLADSYNTVNRFDMTTVTIDRGLILASDELNSIKDYKRHKITPNGVSPRAFPLAGEPLVVTDSDEHNEAGHMIEDAETRTLMMQKRMRKLFSLRQDIQPPKLYGPKNAGSTLIGWGSTFGPLKEAIDLLHHENISVNMVHYSEIWPFYKETMVDIMAHSQHTFTVENNFTGQFADLIAQETGNLVSGRIVKYDGRPFSPEYIVREFNKMGC